MSHGRETQGVIWERRAQALEMYLDGKSYADIGRALGCHRQTASVMCKIGARQLAYRVFYGVTRVRVGTGVYRIVYTHPRPTIDIPPPDDDDWGYNEL